METYLKPVDEIEMKLKIQEGGEGHKHFTHTCRIHMDKYVPMDEGNLAIQNVREETDKVVYASPYAHYMYVGKVMGPNIPIKDVNGKITGWWSPPKKPKHYTGKDIEYSTAQHEYAGPNWAERMMSAEKDLVNQEMQNYINRGGK